MQIQRPQLPPPHSKLESHNPNPEPNSSAAPLNDSAAPSSELAPPSNEEYLRQLFGTLTPIPKTEEENKSDTPLPLLPFEHVLDKIESLPPQSYNPQHLPKLIPPILNRAEQYKLDEYAEYMGRGGTIYVHILSLDHENATFDNKDKKQRITKKHFDEAAAISNERFKKLDIDLKVVIVYDPNSVPLSRKEFQDRKADPKNRRTMPKGFGQEYNPMDTYMVIDVPEREGDEGIHSWLNHLDENNKKNKNEHNPDIWYNDDNSNNSKRKKELGEGDQNSWGRGSRYDFLGFLNMEKAYSFFETIFLNQVNKEENNVEHILVQALAYSIEHEMLHPKLLYYSRNDTQAGNYKFNPANPASFREKTDTNQPGHISGTVMAERPQWRDLQKAENEGYDAYMITILQLLHGKNSRAFDKDFYKETLDNLRKQRDNIAKTLSSIDLKSANAQDALKKFNELELQIEAYVDVLYILDTRPDFQHFLTQKNQGKPFGAARKNMKELNEAAKKTIGNIK